MEFVLLTATQQSERSDGPSMWIVLPLAILGVLVVIAVLWFWGREQPQQRVNNEEQDDNPPTVMEYRNTMVLPDRVNRTPYVYHSDIAGVNDLDTVVIDRPFGGAYVPDLDEDLAFVPPPQPKPAKPQEATMFVGTCAGADVRVPVGHTLIARRTGGGKSNILALLVTDLLAQGVEVWYANAKYMPRSYDKVTGELKLDISPIVARCARAAVDAKDLSRGALNLLVDAAALVQERIHQSQQPGAPTTAFKPVVVVFDELKAAVSDWRKLERRGVEDARDIAAESIETLLTKGREPNVFFITTGQDAQVQSLKLSQGTMTNFMVRIAHPSLDNASMVNVLPKGIKREELPVTSSPFQWYVTSEGEMGSDIIDVVDVPLATIPWVTERLKSVPFRISEPAVDQNQPPQDKEEPTAPANDAEDEVSEMPASEHERNLALVVAWLRREPELTPAEVARRLWVKAAERPKGQGVGSYGVKAKGLLDEAKEVLQRASKQNGVTGSADDGAVAGDDLRLMDGVDGLS